MSVQETLGARNTTHGSFEANAEASQELKAVMLKWWRPSLPAIMRESLHMICFKLSRILTGNFMEPDHWHDIAGYATLVENWLRARQ